MSLKRQAVLLGMMLAFSCAAPLLGDDSDKDSSTQPDNKPDMKEILKKADAATRAVKAVSYKARYFGDGPIAEKVPTLHGSVKARKAKKTIGLGGLLRNKRDQFHFVGTALLPGSDKEIQFDMSTNGKQAFEIDHERKAFSYGPQKKAASLLELPMRLWMIEFLHKTPFSDELRARSREYEGIQKIGDVDCHVIYVHYDDRGSTESRWFFSCEDYLPRRVDRIVKQKGRYQGAGILEITELDANPKLGLRDFQPKCPEGYTKNEFGELIEVGAIAPGWKLAGPNGKTISLKSLRGRVVVIDFWATWCGPCKLSMPGLQELHEQFKDKPVTILGVNCSDRGDAAAYMKSRKYTYPLLLGADKVAKAYNVMGLPTFYVISPDGHIVYRSEGFVPNKKEQLAKIIRDNLPSTP